MLAGMVQAIALNPQLVSKTEFSEGVTRAIDTGCREAAVCQRCGSSNEKKGDNLGTIWGWRSKKRLKPDFPEGVARARENVH